MVILTRKDYKNVSKHNLTSKEVTLLEKELYYQLRALRS